MFGGITAAPGGTPGSSVTSNITGADVLYGGNGNTSGVRGRGRVGVGGGGGQKGLPGIVIVAYQVAADAVRSVGMADGPITKLHHAAANTGGGSLMPIYIKEADGWKPLEAGANPGELPGIGGWADITEVTGTGTKYDTPITVRTGQRSGGTQT